MCSREMEVPEKVREFLGAQIRFNRFVTLEHKLAAFDDTLPPTDSLHLRFTLMILGGLILDTKFEPLPLNYFFEKFHVV